MCRSIKKLRRPGELPTDEELRAAALQFVRKISGYNAPSQANKEAFDRAVREIAEVGKHLFDELKPVPSTAPLALASPKSTRITAT